MRPFSTSTEQYASKENQMIKLAQQVQRTEGRFKEQYIKVQTTSQTC